MKSTNWVINGVLAVAIIVLYVLHFNGSASPSKQAAMQSAGGTKVAYFEIDTYQKKRRLQVTRKAYALWSPQEKRVHFFRHNLNDAPDLGRNRVTGPANRFRIGFGSLRESVTEEPSAKIREGRETTLHRSGPVVGGCKVVSF